MCPFCHAFPALLLCSIGQALANLDPKNYDDVYDFDDYYSSLYAGEDADMLDDAFGCVTRLLAQHALSTNRPFAHALVYSQRKQHPQSFSNSV